MVVIKLLKQRLKQPKDIFHSNVQRECKCTNGTISNNKQSTRLARQGFNVFLVLVVSQLPWMFYRAPDIDRPERLPIDPCSRDHPMERFLHGPNRRTCG